MEQLISSVEPTGKILKILEEYSDISEKFLMSPFPLLLKRDLLQICLKIDGFPLKLFYGSLKIKRISLRILEKYRNLFETIRGRLSEVLIKVLSSPQTC